MIGNILRSIGTRATVARGFFGGNSIKGKLLTSAGFIGAGLGANAYISHVADMKRAYYGEERYNQYFGQGAEYLGGVATMAGLWFGGNALIGRDPITRLKNSYKYFTGDRRAMLDMNTPRGAREAIRRTPRFGALQMITTASIASGGGLASSPGVLLPMLGLAAAGGIAGGALGARRLAQMAGIKPSFSFLKGFATSSAAIGIGAGIGFAGGSRNNNMAAEGNIVEFDKYNSNYINKMNYSTAGLTLALHANNRRM